MVSDRPSNACSLGVIIIGVTWDLLPLGEVMINRCFGFFSSFPSITWTVCSMSDVLRADNQSLFNSFCCSSSYTEPLKHRFSDLCFSVICFAYTALSTPAKLKPYSDIPCLKSFPNCPASTQTDLLFPLYQYIVPGEAIIKTNTHAFIFFLY